MSAGQNDGEIDDCREDRQPDHDVRHVPGGDDAGGRKDCDDDDGQYCSAHNPQPEIGRERIRWCLAYVAELLAVDRVLRETEEHSDRSQTETPMEAVPGLHEAGEQRSDEGTEIDTHVEERESGVAAVVVLLVQIADHRGGGRLESAAAEGDADQPTPTPTNPGSIANAMWPNMMSTAL